MRRFLLSRRARKLVAGVVFLAAMPAAAQLLPGRLSLPTLPTLPAGGLPAVTAPVGRLVQATRGRLDAVAGLLRAHPRELVRFETGIAVRDEILALAPSPATLAAAQAAGYTIAADESDGTLAVRLVTLKPPRGRSLPAALRELRALDPAGSFDVDAVFTPGGAPAAVVLAPPLAGDAPTARVGLIDSGVAVRHPALAAAHIDSRGFAGAMVAAVHGTAVASLLVGRDGAARGAQLFAADVYGDAPTGGSARTIVAAFGWLATAGVGVVNVSLVGPANAALQAAVAAVQARGIVVVAAVGNDGPAAPPLFPASYPGVVAVTGTDARGRLLPEAGQASHVDFAAPGVARVAEPGGGDADVRGTSFAAPLVAGRLAQRHPLAGPGGSEAIAGLVRDGTAPPRR